MPDDDTLATAREARRRLDKNADDPDALLVLALLYAMLSEYGTSLRFLDRLVRVFPGYPGALRLKAQLHRQNGEEEMAARCEETALRTDGA